MYPRLRALYSTQVPTFSLSLLMPCLSPFPGSSKRQDSTVVKSTDFRVGMPGDQGSCFHFCAPHLPPPHTGIINPPISKMYRED